MKASVWVSIFIVSGVAACASSPPSTSSRDAGPRIQGDGVCHAEQVAWAIGMEATQDTMARLWRESGAGQIRPLTPTQPMTHDYRPDRVNVLIDENNRVVRVTCG